MESSTFCTRGWYFELIRTLNCTVQVKIQTRKTRVYRNPKPEFSGLKNTRVGFSGSVKPGLETLLVIARLSCSFIDYLDVTLIPSTNIYSMILCVGCPPFYDFFENFLLFVKWWKCSDTKKYRHLRLFLFRFMEAKLLLKLFSVVSSG